MEQKFRKNHLELSFERKSERPGCIEILDWMDNEIGLAPDLFEGIQFDSMRNSVFLQFFTEEETLRAFRKLDCNLTFETKSGTKFKVFVKKCDEVEKKIRIINLPLGMPNDLIAIVLSKYGTVLNLADERWGKNVKYSNIKTGVRIATMNLKMHIPSYIDVSGYKAFTTYDGQVKTCSVCNSAEHLRSECPKMRLAASRIWKTNSEHSNSKMTAVKEDNWPALPMQMTKLQKQSPPKESGTSEMVIVPETQVVEQSENNMDNVHTVVIPETQEEDGTETQQEAIQETQDTEIEIEDMTDPNNDTNEEIPLIENCASSQEFNDADASKTRRNRSGSRNKNKPYNAQNRSQSRSKKQRNI